MVRARLSRVDLVALALVILGAINWGLVGLLDVNAVVVLLDPIFEEAALSFVARVIYVVVGLAGLYALYPLYQLTRRARQTESSGLLG